MPVVKAEEAKSYMNSKVFWLCELLRNGEGLFELLFVALITSGYASILLILGVYILIGIKYLDMDSSVII